MSGSKTYRESGTITKLTKWVLSLPMGSKDLIILMTSLKTENFFMMREVAPNLRGRFFFNGEIHICVDVQNFR